MAKWMKIVVGIVIVVVLGLFIKEGMLYYLNNKPRRDVSREQALAVSAQQIFDDYMNNDSLANARYWNKAVEVTGEVAESRINQANQTVVLLRTSDPVFGVNCTFKRAPGELKPGTTITFRGICTGFLSDVVVNEGVLVTSATDK